jgi:2-polyprenyl-3-methyl-5-hydroxy-6-metoxy-1,4-benzoquinol methylase
MTVSFALSAPRCRDFRGFLDDWIERSGAVWVADLGGGANPLLSTACVARHGLEYTVIDIAQAELDKGPREFHKLRLDLGARDFDWGDERPQFDLVFSRMLAEHVPCGETFHRNVRRLLAPGGVALHCFPTLYSPPFVLNKLAAERLSDWLLRRLQPRDRFQYGKFPAYYSWCRGPSRRQLRRLAGLGYEVLEYRGYFGHPYFEAFPALDLLERRFAARLLARPLPWLTSYAFVALRKPAAVAVEAEGLGQAAGVALALSGPKA